MIGGVSRCATILSVGAPSDLGSRAMGSRDSNRKHTCRQRVGSKLPLLVLGWITPFSLVSFVTDCHTSDSLAEYPRMPASHLTTQAPLWCSTNCVTVSVHRSGVAPAFVPDQELVETMCLGRLRSESTFQDHAWKAARPQSIASEAKANIRQCQWFTVGVRVRSGREDCGARLTAGITHSTRAKHQVRVIRSPNAYSETESTIFCSNRPRSSHRGDSSARHNTPDPLIVEPPINQSYS